MMPSSPSSPQHAVDDLVTFLEVVAGAHQLHIILGDRGATLRVGQVVIEVQLLGRAADDAFPAVSLPHRQLYGRRYDPSPAGMESGGTTQIVLSFDRDQLELEHLPVAIVLLPRVHEVEYAIVGPYALA